MSVVYYIPTEDDELLISTMAERGKARAVERSQKVSLCVPDEHWPFAYLQVYADAVIGREADLVVDVMMAVAGRMSGEPLGEEARPFVTEMAAQEERNVQRCRPARPSPSLRVTCTGTTRTKRSRTGCRRRFHRMPRIRSEERRTARDTQPSVRLPAVVPVVKEDDDNAIVGLRWTSRQMWVELTAGR